jgi:hypothetical protein
VVPAIMPPDRSGLPENNAADELRRRNATHLRILNDPTRVSATHGPTAPIETAYHGHRREFLGPNPKVVIPGREPLN